VAAKEDRTYNGVVYHSKAEAKRAFELDCMKAARQITGWKRQRGFPLLVNGVFICTYYADFQVWGETTDWAEEIKGHETEVYKLKLKLFRALYPDVELRIIKA
jgi:hypothetical protein